MTNYKLINPVGKEKKISVLRSLKRLLTLLKDEKRNIVLATVAVFISSGLNLLAPVIIGYTVDKYILTGQYHGVIVFSVILFAMYLGAVVAGYFQTMLMGTVGQHLLFNLRNVIFNKIQLIIPCGLAAGPYWKV